MTQLALDRAVAAATGEPLAAVRRLGFGPDAPDPGGGDVALALDCPFCGHPVAYPGRSRRGEAALAECARCDVYFDFDDAEVYVSDATDLADAA